MVILFISHVHFLRDALVAILQTGDDQQALGAFSRDTVEAAMSEVVPDLVIIDASHPDGTALVAAVRARAPQVSVIVLGLREQDEDFLAWATIGIAGYLGPDTSARDLLSTVRRAGAGEVVCPPRLTALLLNRFATRANDRATRPGVHTLTAREREIAELLAQGMSNKLIARQLRVALPTVKNHVHSILEKWDVRSRGEAAAYYRQKSHETIEPSGVRLTVVQAGGSSQAEGSTPRPNVLRPGMSSLFGRRAA